MAPNEVAGGTGQGDGKAIHNSKNKDQLAEAGRRKLEEFRRKQREKAAAPKKSPTGLAPTTPTPSSLPPPPPLSQVSTNHETLVAPEIAPPIRAPPIKPPSSTSSSPVPSPHPAAPALATIPLRSSPQFMPPSTSATATSASSLPSENHNRASTAAPEGKQLQGSYNASAHSSFQPPPLQGQTERSRATPFASRPLFDTSRAESKPFGGLSPMERQSDANANLAKASPPPVLNNFRPSPPTFSNTRAPALQHREKGTAPPTPLEGPPTTQEPGRSSSSLEPASLQSVLLTQPGPGSRSSNSYPPHVDSDHSSPAPPLPPSHDTPSASPVLSVAVTALPSEKAAVATTAPFFVPAAPSFSPPNGRQVLPETSKSELETSGPEAAKSSSSTSASSASVSSRASSIWSFVAPMPASKHATKSSSVPIPPSATLPQTSAPTVPDLPQASAEPIPPPSSTQPSKPPSADTSPPTQLPHKPPPSSKPDPAPPSTKSPPTSSPNPTPPANAEKEPTTRQAPPVTPSLAPEPPKPSPKDSKKSTLVSPVAKQPDADKVELPLKAIKSSSVSTPIESLLSFPPSKPFQKQAPPPPPSVLSRDPIKHPRAALPPSSLRPSLPPPPPFLPPRKAELPSSSSLGGEETRGSTAAGFDFVGLLSSRQQQEGEPQQSSASAAIAARGAEVDRWRKSGELPPPPSQATASPLGREPREAPVVKEGAAMNGKARGGGGGALWGSEFGALEQHIEDLTQEKYALQRGLDAARALAESLANENEALTETFNRQGQVVAQLQAEIDKLGEEIQAQKVVVTAAQEERERALGESSASAERSRSLAAENVALEEKILRLRSNELKLERDIQSLRNEIENGKRTVAMMDKDRSSMRSTIDALQEDKRGLQVRLRKAALGGVLESVRGPQVNRVEASTSTDDLAPPIPSPPAPTPNLASEDTAQSGLPSTSPTSSYTIPLEDNEPSSTSLSEASRAPPGSAAPEPVAAARAASFAPLRSLGARVRSNSFSLTDLSSIPDDEARTIESIDRLITELTEERRAVHMALQAEVASSAELRTANSELSRKLAVQTQRLELAVAQNMARQSNGESSSHTPREEEIIDFAPEYMDENDEVVERVLSWIMRLIPGGSSKRSLEKRA